MKHYQVAAVASCVFGLVQTALPVAQAQAEKTESRMQAVLRANGTFLADGGGFKISDIVPNGPADTLELPNAATPTRGSLEEGDIITAIDGKKFRDRREFLDLLNAANLLGGGKVRLTVRDAVTNRSAVWIARPEVLRDAQPAKVVPTSWALKNGTGKIDGKLTMDDIYLDGSFAKIFVVKMSAGVAFQIDLESKDTYPLLYLQDAGGKFLGYGRGPKGNSRFLFNCERDGDYEIVVKTYVPKPCSFTLTIRQNRRFAGPALNDGIRVEEDLAAEDAEDLFFAPSPCKIYAIPMSAGKTYRADMQSKDFDSFLRLADAVGWKVDQGESGADSPSARIVFNCDRTGIYHLTATTRVAKTGRFTLTVRAGAPAKPIVADLVVRDNGLGKAEGQLTVEDGPDKVFKTERCRIYEVALTEGDAYYIDVKSTDFVPRMRLEDASGIDLAQRYGQRIVFNCDHTGTYRVVATSEARIGGYTLTVFRRPPAKRVEEALMLERGLANVEEKLTAADGTKVTRPRKVYTVTLKAGGAYQVDMVSKDFASALSVQNSAGTVLDRAETWAGGGVRIYFNCQRDGVYDIVAGTSSGKTGAFNLTVQQKTVLTGPELNAAVRKLFEEKGLSLRLIPAGPFQTKDIDPLLVDAQWEVVRPDLEKLYERSLNIPASYLLLRFVAVDDPTGKKPKSLRAVFWDPGEEVRRSLIASLALTELSFEVYRAVSIPVNQVEISPGRVAGQNAVKAMDLVAVSAALKDEFGQWKLTPLATPLAKKVGFQIYSNWVFWQQVEEPSLQLYYWRVNMTLERKETQDDKAETLETWAFRTVLEIGRRTGKDQEVKAIQHTDKHFFGEWLDSLQKPPQQTGRYKSFGQNRNATSGGEDERFDVAVITEAPLVQMASSIFQACYQRIMRETGWKLPTRPQKTEAI